MQNGCETNVKPWYKSRTVWLMAAQLLTIWSAFFTGEASVNTLVALSCMSIGGMINRYYTDQSIRKINGG